MPLGGEGGGGGGAAAGGRRLRRDPGGEPGEEDPGGGAAAGGGGHGQDEEGRQGDGLDELPEVETPAHTHLVPGYKLCAKAQGLPWLKDCHEVPRYDTIIAWMEQLAAEHPEVVTITELGRSHEDRRILMMKIGRWELEDGDAKLAGLQLGRGPGRCG